MRVMLVDDDAERLLLLETSLLKDGHEIVARLGTEAALQDAVARHQPEVILIDLDAPSRDTLESLDRISRDQPKPIVMFAAASDTDTIQRAVRAGVSAYVVDGLNPARLKPIMEVAIARFHEFQALKRELEDTKARLADRQDVERAKGLLMQRRSLDEEQAYALLRKVAMDRKLRIGEAARIIIAAAEIL